MTSRRFPSGAKERIDRRRGAGRIAFVYSGNGAQWMGMGRQAMATDARFRAAITRVDGHLGPLLGWSVTERLEQETDETLLARIDVAQPLLFALQVAIVETLSAEGVTADVHLGHSVGEIAAAWAAGMMDLPTACRVAAVRSRHQQSTQGAGRMAVVNTGATELALDLGDFAGLEIAAVNSERSVTVAGPLIALEGLHSRLEARGGRFQLLDLDYAFHSAAMDPIRADLLSELSDLPHSGGGAEFVSTVEGGAVGTDGLDAVYWWRNIREPVQFAPAMGEVIGRGYRIFVEIGPAAILQTYMRDALRTAGAVGAVEPTLRRRAGEQVSFARIAGAIQALDAEDRRRLGWPARLLAWTRRSMHRLAGPRAA